MTKLSDSYCTPECLARLVGTFDTDPCSNPRSHIVARNRIMLEDGRDGLTEPWLGRTWLNHPYSFPWPWMRKLGYERAMGRVTESLVLAKLDTSTMWWHELTDRKHGPCTIWMFDDRLSFDIPPELLAEMQAKWEAKGHTGNVPTSNNFCSVIVHHGNGILPLESVATPWRIYSP